MEYIIIAIVILIILSVAMKLNRKDFAIKENTVISEDGLWNHYDTIIGARHSLIENGALAPTLSSETSNGTSARVPRTAIGVTSDGKVVIVSVEDLHYGKKADVCTGMTATQLADFMRYFGCYDAANFDGGGSSQLVINDNGSYISLLFIKCLYLIISNYDIFIKT